MLFLGLYAVLCASNHKVAIFDAGSSGTRVYLYQYSDAADPTNYNPILGPNNKPLAKRIEIPVAKCQHNLSLADEIVDNLLAFVDEHIPEAERKNVPILFYCTAGMRLISADSQKKILDRLFERATSKKSYKTHRGDFRVIAGYEEALFAWIAVNRLLDTFGPPPTTLPIIEIGGASAQFAAKKDLEGATKEERKYLYKVNIGERSYSIFAHSWLGFGADQATLTINKKLRDQGSTEHPCLLNGTELDFEGHLFRGSANRELCMSILSDAVYKKNETCGNQPCLFGEVPLPGTYPKVFAAGLPQYQEAYLGFKDEANISTFRALSDKFATQTYEEVHEKYPDNIFIKYLYIQQNIVLTFFEKGLSATNSVIVKAPMLVNNSEPQWTLGAVLTKFSPGVSIKKPGFWYYAGIALICLAVAVTIAFLVLYLLRKRSSKAEETNSIYIDLIN